ncbi:CLIP domain-containing serine protease B14-like [Anopheles nili]|uniref:CLIP domain-containing serine protease B14-like n=1 Tax=Anopheles nili TaxID=185578 RepID=UPI00237A7282|nr:CLIP domain-containing serine protease B14-like [Anopheles nili]
MHRSPKPCFNLFALVAIVMIGGSCTDRKQIPCTTPNQTLGWCVRVRDCDYILDYMSREQELLYNDTAFLEGLKCGNHVDGSVLVCCPRLVNGPKCGPFSFKVRVHGGNDTEIGEYPWLALLRFQARNRKFHANCAGSLVGGKFVVTAAHCFLAAKKKGWKIHSVRVAEWNFMNHRSSKDCKQLTDHDTPICRKDYDVARVVLHPHYRVNYVVHENDIALIELVQNVEFGTFVAPICLPLADDQLAPVTNETEYTAAGWGSTEEDDGMSHLLKQINLRWFEKDRCRRIFSVPSGTGIGEGHICAGGIRGEDTCHGDSGGPLMELHAGQWYLAGLTSFGWPTCGKDGVPGVYTNVSHYLRWLEREIYRGVLV